MISISCFEYAFCLPEQEKENINERVGIESQFVVK